MNLMAYKNNLKGAKKNADQKPRGCVEFETNIVTFSFVSTVNDCGHNATQQENIIPFRKLIN